MDARRMARLATRLATRVAGDENDLGFDPLSMKVARWLFDNPNPSDEKFHEWAKSEKIEPSDAETAAYRLGSTFATFMFAGRADKEGITAEDVDQEQLSMGIAVEMEHTVCRTIAARIALDHLAEIDDYYTRLKKMEEDAGAEY